MEPEEIEVSPHGRIHTGDIDRWNNSGFAEHQVISLMLEKSPHGNPILEYLLFIHTFHQTERADFLWLPCPGTRHMRSSGGNAVTNLPKPTTVFIFSRIKTAMQSHIQDFLERDTDFFFQSENSEDHRLQAEILQ